MEDILRTIGRNINYLMKAKGISMRALADVIGVKHPTMSSYISGESAIDSAKLYKLAEYFGVSFDDFFRNDIKECTLMFRADKPAENFTGLEKKFIVNRILEYIEIVGKNQFVAYIPQNYSFKLEGRKISLEEDLAIRRIAKEQRRNLGIENLIPESYYQVFAENNINVFAFELQNENISGCSFIDHNFGNLIYINTFERLSEERQLFSLCHEYAHLLFHRDEYFKMSSETCYESKRKDIREKLADKFAGYFLVPEELLRDRLEEKEYASSDGINIMALKNYFKVSYQAMLMALHNYDIISDAVYKKAFENLMKKGYRTVEPMPIDKIDAVDKNILLLKATRQRYLRREITANKIAEVLNLHQELVRKLIGRWNAEEEKREEEKFETIQV